jgi:hypothetical protein
MQDSQKIHIQSLGETRCRMQMNNNGHTPRRRRIVDYAAAAIEQMKHYCAAHPGSPSAVRRPQLSSRGDLWIALLGPNVEEGIVGIGPSVAAALRAFDAQYLIALRPRNERPTNSTKRHRFSGSASAAAD